MEKMTANYHFLQNLWIKRELLCQRKFKSSIQSWKLTSPHPAVMTWFSLKVCTYFLYTCCLFFFFFEEYQYFTRLRPMAPKISKLNQAPYKQNNMQNNSKTSLFTNSLSPLTWKGGLGPGQITSFSTRDVNLGVYFINVMFHSACLHIPFPFCYALPSFSSESPFMNNLNELFEACNPK